MIYGCHACRFLCSIEVLYYTRDIDVRVCPSCGRDDVSELGEDAPSVVEMDGKFYMVDNNNCMGPYPGPIEAQADLWNWFGVANDNEEDEGENHQFKVIEGGFGEGAKTGCGTEGGQEGDELDRQDQQEPELQGQGTSAPGQ